MAAASAVEFTGTATVKTIAGINVQVFPTANVTVDEATIPVRLSGSGVRKKLVLFFTVDVYAATSYVEDPAQLQAANPMEGIRGSRAKVLQLTMLRNMSGADIRTAFEEALDLNAVDLNNPAVRSVLGRFNMEARPGDIFTVAGFTKANGEQGVEIKFPSTTTQDSGTGLADDFWKVWFGTPIDDEMLTLQRALIGQ